MDPARFDALVRGGARRGPRRVVLRGLAGVMALLGADQFGSAAALGRRKKCAPGLTRCVVGHGKHVKRACVDLQGDPQACALCRRSSLEAACPVGPTGFLTYRDGRMRCAAADNSACACLGAYRACLAGTACRSVGDAIICDAPQGG